MIHIIHIYTVSFSVLLILFFWPFPRQLLAKKIIHVNNIQFSNDSNSLRSYKLIWIILNVFFFLSWS